MNEKNMNHLLVQNLKNFKVSRVVKKVIWSWTFNRTHSPYFWVLITSRPFLLVKYRHYVIWHGDFPGGTTVYQVRDQELCEVLLGLGFINCIVTEYRFHEYKSLKGGSPIIREAPPICRTFIVEVSGENKILMTRYS